MSNLSFSSKSSKNNEVVSVYFASKHVGMDESASDFKAPKNNYRNRKPVATSKTKQTRKKKLKGQKDIKSAFKGKNNELVKYSKDFDKVCKETGIDVDSEQLQLAIALSKSLQDTNVEKKCDQPSNSSNIVSNIKTTLREYGFTIPDIKICLGSKKNIKKNYKLLNVSEVDRKQVISDKYSKVLLNYSTSTRIEKTYNEDKSNKWISLATNISYNDLKNNSNFHVEGLLDVCYSFTGSLLRDWSMIPGRPISPPKENLKHISLCNMDFNSEEMDVILSGSLSAMQQVVNTKQKVIGKNVTQVFEQNLCPDVVNIRSVSPDIFDDELSSVIDNTNTMIGSQKSESDFEYQDKTRKKSNDFMDLTECVNAKALQLASANNKKQANTFINDENKTQINCLDMEITECLNDKDPAVDINNVIECHINLTKDNDEDQDKTIIVNDYNKTLKTAENTIFMDLTQSSDSNNDTLPAVYVKDTQKAEPQQVTDQDQEESVINLVADIDVDKENEHNSKSNENSFDEYNFVHSDHEYEDNKDIEVILDKSLGETSTNTNVVVESNFILGKLDDVSIDYDEISSDIKSNSKIEESVDKSNLIDTDEIVTNEVEYIEEINNSNIIESTEKNTSNSVQSLEVFEVSDEEFNYSIHKSKLRSSDACNDIPEAEDENISFEIPKENLFTEEPLSESNHNITIASLNTSLPLIEVIKPKVKMKSPVKENTNTPLKTISKELNLVSTPSNSDYVIKSNNVTPMLDFNSMSTPDMNTELDKYGLKPFKRKRAIQLLTHVYNQTHPVVETCTEESTPKKKQKFDTLSQLENKGDSLSNENVEKTTPRKKSQLKPIKSKRGEITPIKSTNEKISPIKSIRQERTPKKSTPKKRTGKKVTESSTCNEVEIDIENFIYLETNLCQIKEVFCSPEDWVFQKREKAKIHSCRVPLHIALHNYVTSRQKLREAILRYEPVNIDLIHKDLISYGHRYDPKDLLKYLDKKCITVKTMDNNARNNKIPQRKL